jgi:serine protease Do
MMTRPTRTTIALLVLMAFVAGAFTVTAGADWLGLTDAFRPAHADDREGGTRIERTFDNLDDAFVEVADRVNPTVVQIAAARTVTSGPQTQRDLLEQFFGGGGLAPRNEIPRSGLGSGVIFREDGYIVTNDHVISGADDLRVTLFNGEQYDGELIGTDPASDLAVIRIERSGLPFVSLGSVDDVRVGQWAIAFGSPLDAELSNTVTAGIVSAIGRYNNQTQRGNADILLQGYIQTDAAINPGNSGGPLVNLRGELIGLNNAIYTRTGGYQGIGFAIPVDAIRNATEQIIETGEVRRAYLGIGVGPVSQSLARALDVPVGSAQVGNVQPGTAADRAGLQAGDLITAIDGVPLRDSREVTRRILNKRPGSEITLDIVRGDDRRQLQVELGERDFGDEIAEERPSRTARPDAEASGARAEAQHVESLGFTYVDLADLTPAERQRFFGRNAPNEGVGIVEVDRRSQAYRDAGVQPGFLIDSVDGRDVRTMREFERAYEAVDEGETFLISLRAYAQDGSETLRRTALTKPR